MQGERSMGRAWGACRSAAGGAHPPGTRNQTAQTQRFIPDSCDAAGGAAP
jgi:hypothetical protein